MTRIHVLSVRNVFHNLKSLWSHMNVHSSKYQCSECGKCCQSNHSLMMHKRWHSGEKPFECNVCGKRFSQSPNLAVHSRIHSGEKPYKCSLCDKHFRQSSNLQSHKRHVHNNRKPYQCRLCGKLFKVSDTLKFHVRIHTDAKPYSCRHCSDCFTWHHQLKTHLLKSHNEGTWFTCDICQKKFSSKQACVLCIAVICRCSTQYSFQLRALWCILI